MLTTYSGAAALVSAIRAAAGLAPEIAPELEFPDRYAPGYYPHTAPAEYETGAPFYVGPVSTVGRELIESDGPACYWPRVDRHPEKPGPFLPMPADARAVFRYTASGARGSLTVSNTRPALLALADKVHANRGAFDGKAKRAAKPAKPASSAPHVAARAFWEAGQHAEALQLAENVGALYFGHSGEAGAHPYMQAQHVDAAGHAFVIARSIRGGRFRVLGAASGLAGDVVRGGAPTDAGFSTYSAALDWLETSAQCEAWCANMAGALAKAAPMDQSAARAFYLADIDAAADAPETAPAAPIDAPATIGTSEPAGAPVAAAIEPAAPISDPAAIDPEMLELAAGAILARALVSRFGVSDPAACAHLPGFAVEFEQLQAAARADALARLAPAAAVPSDAPAANEPNEPGPDAPAPAARAPRDGDVIRVHELKRGAPVSEVWSCSESTRIRRDYEARQMVIGGHCGGSYRWVTCDTSGAFLYGLGPDGREITAAPAAVSTGAPVNPGPDAPAPGASMRPGPGMLSEAEARGFDAAAAIPGAVIDARAVFDAATCAAAIELERITCSLASDPARRRVIDAGRSGAIGSRAAVVAMLERFAIGAPGDIGAAAARRALAELAAADAARFTAGAARADAIGNDRRADVLRDLAAEALAEIAPPTREIRTAAAGPLPGESKPAPFVPDAAEVQRVARVAIGPFETAERAASELRERAGRLENAKPHAAAGGFGATVHRLGCETAATWRAAADAIDAAARSELKPARKRGAGLAGPEHIEHDQFAAGLESGAITLQSVGSENAYGVRADGSECFAKDVDRATLERFERAPVDVFADGCGFHFYSLADGSKWTGRPSFEAAAAELAGMGYSARAAGAAAPLASDSGTGRYATDTHDRPCAAPGLTSYRARGVFGWIMIGATDAADAMREARRSTAEPHGLEVWDGARYVACVDSPPPTREFETIAADPVPGNSAPLAFRRLRLGDAFQFETGGPVWVRARGGFRPGRGGQLHACTPHTPVIRYAAPVPADESPPPVDTSRDIMRAHAIAQQQIQTIRGYSEDPATQARMLQSEADRYARIDPAAMGHADGRYGAIYANVSAAMANAAQFIREGIEPAPVPATDPGTCRHPPARYFTGYAMHADGETRLWVACCDCGEVLRGGTTLSEPEAADDEQRDPDHAAALTANRAAVLAAALPLSADLDPVPADPIEDETTPAPLDGLEVSELGPEALDAFELPEPTAPAYREGLAKPAEPYRIPPGDLRARIPARFAPVYILNA